MNATNRLVGLALSAAIAAAACSGKHGGAPPTVFGGDRPVTLQVPPGYDPSKPTPLVLLIHAYGVDGPIQEAYFHAGAIVTTGGALLLAPDGTKDPSGNRFWNATPGCCNLYGSSVDDDGYLKGLLHDVRAAYNVDPKRIFAMGHSNGAFMAHRLACDDSTEIAGIVSLAGETYLNPSDCTPTAPVSVLQIQGTADAVIPYGGGQVSVQAFPGAIETVNDWQPRDGCAPGLVDDPTPLDLDSVLIGAETTAGRFSGCTGSSGVELWTIQGGSHIPALYPSFALQTYAWLQAHPKP